MKRRFTRTGFSVGSSHRVYCDLCALYVNFRHVFLLLSGFLSSLMDRLSSSASTASSIDDYSGHNMWNPPLELLFLEHVNGIVGSYLVDLDLAKIALCF